MIATLLIKIRGPKATFVSFVPLRDVVRFPESKEKPFV